MAARFQVGQILQGQGKFDEAIAAYKGYLAKYPNGPQSADAQRALLDVQVLIAQDLLRREKYAEARAAFLAFAAQNPLDARVPQLLFEVGQAYHAEKKYDEAIAAWETLAGKFPGTEPAGHAQFAIAVTLEVDKGDPAAAIERYQKVAVEPWHGQARQRIAVMEAKALTVVTERAFRSGETPQLKIATRNLEKLTFTAYKIDPETYFRKKHALRGVEALDIGLVAPDAEWTAEVPGYGKYKPIETTYELKKLELPGVYVVKVSDEKTLQATTLVLGSDLDAIVKTSREQVLVFAQDMKTGKGRARARVLVSDDEGVILDARTGEDGVLVRNWEQPRRARARRRTRSRPPPRAEPAPARPGPALPLTGRRGARPRCARRACRSGAISYLVLDGDDVAGSGLVVPEKVAQGLSARAYLYTDRPAYRPGHDVAAARRGPRGRRRPVRQRARRALLASRSSTAGAASSSAARSTLSDFGTFHETVPLDAGAPVGIVPRPAVSSPARASSPARSRSRRTSSRRSTWPSTCRGPSTIAARRSRGRSSPGTSTGRRWRTGRSPCSSPTAGPSTGQTDAAGKYAFELETDRVRRGAGAPPRGAAARRTTSRWRRP